jgi:hypothetical protein
MTSQQVWNDFFNKVALQLAMQGTTAPMNALGISYPQAVELIRQLNGAAPNADSLCQIAFSYPVAIELARQMRTGAGNAGALHRMGFSASTAEAVAAAIRITGARS